MTDNRRRASPPIQPTRSTPPPSTSLTPPAITPVPVRPNPDRVTVDDIRKDFGQVAFMLANPDKMEEDREAAFRAFNNVTRYAVGDSSYGDVYKIVMTNLLEKGGAIGAEIFETMQRKTDDTFPTKNAMISSVKKARIFGDDDKVFSKNYKAVRTTLQDIDEEHERSLQAAHAVSLEELINNAKIILSGEREPIITSLTAAEKTKYMEAYRP